MCRMRQIRLIGVLAGLLSATALGQDFPTRPPPTPERAEEKTADPPRAEERDDAPAGGEPPAAPAPIPDPLPPNETDALDSPLPRGEGGGRPYTLLGGEVAPASRAQLRWTTTQSFVGADLSVPVWVSNGAKRGPVLCLTAAIHGDELNGIEVVRRIVHSIAPERLSGVLIGVPIVNMAGFSRGSRYLPDRRDLNRFFPGNPNGSAASRIAYSFFHDVISHCGALVDFHTGSLDRANLPQVRGDLRIPAVVELTRGFGNTTVLHSPGAPGMLRTAAAEIGIPAVTFELGAPIRLQPEEIEHGVKAIETLLDRRGMINQLRVWKGPQPVYYDSRWIRVAASGMLFTEVELGQAVAKGQRLGRVVDPLEEGEEVEIRAPFAGRVLGKALNQIVLPGFAAFHIGVATSEARAVQEARAIGATTGAAGQELEQVDEGAPPADPEANGEEELEGNREGGG